MISADDIIRKLKLEPLPGEGGYYRESYRSSEIVSGDALPSRFGRDKFICTAIYYLLTPDTHSKLHRLPADEIYHFYVGDPVKMLLLYENGKGETITLGSDIEAGQHVQFVVPRGVWQGSYLIEGGHFALMGTTMAPGFDFKDYKSADEEHLIRIYPGYGDLIRKLCS
jgi:predicted cupin superfamily sugar epimerase